MIPPPQTAGGVQTYPTFDNSIPYNTYGPTTTTGKPNVNNNATSVQYATNHLSTLNLQSQHDDYQARLINNQQTRFSHSNGSTTNNQQRNFMGRPLVQSPNGSTTTPRMTIYSTLNQQYRQSRPLNISNTDKQITSIENDPKSLTSTQQQQQNNSDNNSLAGPAQGKN
jgi:predicted amidohydrolase